MLVELIMKVGMVHHQLVHTLGWYCVSFLGERIFEVEMIDGRDAL